MRTEYSKWIEENVTEAFGTCKEVTAEMQKAFPELLRVRGHYYCHQWGERAHWWLETFHGAIVDPTASQFPSKGNGEYVEWDASAPEPTGKCLNCGDLVYDGKTCCSENCSISAAAECMGNLR